MKHEGQEDPAAELYWLRHQKDKKDLIRIVRTPDGDIVLDRTGKKAGRGAYVCDDPSCIQKAFASKSLERAFDIPVSKECKDALLEELKNHEDR